MLLVYMAGNLAMKSITTPILHRFGFRDVIRVNGTLCVASLVACGLLSPAVPMPVIYARALRCRHDALDELHVDGTLAFADVSASDASGRHYAGGDGAAGRQCHWAWRPPCWHSACSRRSGRAAALTLRDFQYALFVSAALMAIASAVVAAPSGRRGQ